MTWDRWIVYGAALLGALASMGLLIAARRDYLRDQQDQRERERQVRLDAAFRISGAPFLVKGRHQKARADYQRVGDRR